MIKNTKIIDCFMFGQEYELSLLDLRLEYLDSVVDYFVLVEARFTQLGDQKDLFFDKNKNRFEKYGNKIIHIIVDNPLGSPWENENYQRNQILLGLNKISISPNDIIIISDLDEIPNKGAIQYYIDNNICGLANTSQDFYYYFLNFKTHISWNGSQFIRGQMYIDGVTPQSVRQNRKKKKCIMNTHGGWHFSYMGGSQAVITKINSIVEGYVHKRHATVEDITSFMNNQIYKQSGVTIDLKKVNVFEIEFPETFKNRYQELVNTGLIKD
jgi:beta-1,4-mannosyl-glycoprotein beta-1,4-N-acetylglucosaminyltransferase